MEIMQSGQWIDFGGLPHWCPDPPPLNPEDLEPTKHLTELWDIELPVERIVDGRFVELRFLLHMDDLHDLIEDASPEQITFLKRFVHYHLPF